MDMTVILPPSFFVSGLWMGLTAKQRDIALTCLFLAHKSRSEVKVRNEIFICEPGEFITSYKQLVALCAKDVTIQNVRTSLKKLELTGFLTKKLTKQQLHINIANWEFFDVSEKKSTKQLTKRSTKWGKNQALDTMYKIQNTYIQNTHNTELYKYNSSHKNATDEKETKKEDRRNIHVQLLGDLFLELTGQKPIDTDWRRQAYALSRKIRTMIKNRGKVEANDENVSRAIEYYFHWLEEKKWTIYKMRTVREHFVSFEAEISGSRKGGDTKWRK